MSAWLALSFKLILLSIALAGEDAFPANRLEPEPHSADARKQIDKGERAGFVSLARFRSIHLPQQTQKRQPFGGTGLGFARGLSLEGRPRRRRFRQAEPSCLSRTVGRFGTDSTDEPQEHDLNT